MLGIGRLLLYEGMSCGSKKEAGNERIINITSQKAVEELNKVEGFYPLELARVISNEGQEEQRYLDVKYRKLWFRLVNPTGKIISRIVHFTENMAVVEVKCYNKL